MSSGENEENEVNDAEPIEVPADDAPVSASPANETPASDAPTNDAPLKFASAPSLPPEKPEQPAQAAEPAAEAAPVETKAAPVEEVVEDTGPSELDEARAKLPWYVVQTYSGYEMRAKLNLEERVRSHGLTPKFGN